MMDVTTWDHWLYLIVPFGAYFGIVLALVLAGRPSDKTDIVSVLCHPISSSLERLTGYPGWSMAGVLTGLFLLGIGVFGLYWDVAFHIDHGRDENLFTPSHTMIVLALGGLLCTAGVVVLFATLDRASVGRRIFGLRVPWSALALGALGLGGLIAFPLDELWHRAFGIDITLWSPTHLMLVGGGSLATIALWLMLVEARSHAKATMLGRFIEVVVVGAILTGLTTLQGEFDFGVPQFQVLYLPVLAAAAAGFALVLARVSLGPGGALKAMLAFVVLRGGIALIIGGPLNHTVPRFPLYLGAVVAVEVAGLWVGTHRRLRFAIVAGGLVGTLGLAGEIAWLALLDWFHVSPSVLPKAIVLAPLTAGAAAVLAVGLARVVAGGTPVRPAVVAAGLAALVAAFAYPLPRNVGEVEAVIRLETVGAFANVEVELVPPDAARDASAFGLVAWQGGGRVLAELAEVAPGRYESSQPVPVSGSWKSMVGLQRGDQVMAAPLYLPADPEIGASAVPAVAERRVDFVRNTEILLREAHDGPAWPAVVAFGGLAAMMAVWLGLFALCAARLTTRGEPRDGREDEPRPHLEPAAAGDLSSPRPTAGWAR
jgi:hypothetical protein